MSLNVLARNGETLDLKLAIGQSLMEGLREAELGVEGTCGGMSSCGSCHVYAGPELLAAAPLADEDEQAMLEGLAEVVDVRPSSRLACQIPVTSTLEGMSLEIAPQI